MIIINAEYILINLSDGVYAVNTRGEENILFAIHSFVDFLFKIKNQCTEREFCILQKTFYVIFDSRPISNDFIVTFIDIIVRLFEKEPEIIFEYFIINKLKKD